MREYFVGTFRHHRSVGVRHRAVYLVLHHLFVVALLVSVNCSAQQPPTPRPHVVLDMVDFGIAWPREERVRVVSKSQEYGTHRLDGRVELLAPVASDSDPVSDKSADKKSKRAEQYRVDSANEFKELLHLLSTPALWLLFGLFVGGAFDMRRSK